MKIALIGATGNIGKKILNEALNRGHEVTAIARHVEDMPSHPRLHARQGDVADGPGMTALLRGHEAVVSSLHFSAFDPDMLLSAVKASGVKRYIAVGGAGSLEIVPGQLLVNSDKFPAEWKEEATKGVEYLKHMRAEDDLDWTFISPSALIAPGTRTAKYRLGKDQLLVDEKGESHISQEDYAVALVDELEKPEHIRARFTVGY